MARAKAGGLRGDARHALIARLALLDTELLEQAQASLDEGTRAALAREADAELAPRLRERRTPSSRPFVPA